MKQKEFIGFISDVINQAKIRDLRVKSMSRSDLDELGGPHSNLGAIIYDGKVPLINIYQTDITVAGIGRKAKVPGFVADFQYIIPATREQPEDWDVKEVAVGQDLGNVVMKTLSFIVQQRVNDYLQYLYEQQYAKEIEKIHESGGHF